MRHFFIRICSIMFLGLLFSCSDSKQQQQNDKPDNPLLQKSTLQYQAPPFDKIKDEHFKPAFDYALKAHDAEVEKIANNTEASTFANTVLAIEASGQDLNRATLIFSNLTGSNTNAQLQAIEEEYAPIFSAHNDKLYLNSKIYQRIKAIDISKLEGEDKRLTEYYLQQFELAGANLDDANKKKLGKINEELAILVTQYSNRLLVARKNATVYFDTEAELEGLSKNDIALAAAEAEKNGKKGKFAIGIINTTKQPLLRIMKNRASREKLFKASWLRAEKGDEGDTRDILKKLVKLRLTKAQLLGKKNFAEWKLRDQMAKTPEAAMGLLSSIAPFAVMKVKNEAKEIQQLIDARKGNFKLEPWDWDFYVEQVRKAKYNLNESEVKPYFEVTAVLEKGIFFAAKQMYGITFKVRKDLPVYHPDVVAYEVFDKDGSSMAIYYLDFYTRDNKLGGAWMSSFANQSHYLKQKPIIVNVFNFRKPTDANPSLINFDDVTIMFHEFGHTLHGLFANQNYRVLSGTNVPNDYAEFPSQMNEHAALDPVVLENYAIHYKTKQRIPQTLIAKIKKADAFNRGYTVTELLEAATIDMAWHTVENEEDIRPSTAFGNAVISKYGLTAKESSKGYHTFEQAALAKYGLLLNEVPPRYHTPYFAHIWTGVYAAGYYGYIWSKVLDYNAYDWFKANGGMTRQNCERFRTYVLSVGNSVDLNKTFVDMIGHEMQVEPYLRNAGLN